MKKIVVSSNTCWNIYNFRFNLIKSLLEKGYKIIILANLDETCIKLKEMGCEIYLLNFSRKNKSIFESISLFFSYFFYLKKIKPQVFLSYTIKPNLIGGFVANFFKINTILNFTGLGTLILDKNYANKIVFYFLKLTLRKSSIIFFHNNHDLDIFKRKKILNNSNFAVIPGSGVDLKKFKFHPLKFSKDLVFLFIGRLIKDKGIVEYILAANKIKKKYFNVKFLAIGDIDRDNISTLTYEQINNINKFKNVEFLGFKENIIDYIIESTCVVLPSYREGMSKSLLEAGSVGRPIIASNVPGCQEIIIDEHNGFLCEPKNSKDLENVMEKFINISKNEKILFSKRSRLIVENNYDEKNVINRYINEIEKYV